MATAVGIMADSYVAPGGGWTPASLAGLTLWLDADDVTTFTFSSGTTISEWRDKSGAGNHFNTVQATAPERSGTLNGRAAVVFGGAGGLRTSAAVQVWDATTGAVTMVAVVQRDTNTTGRYIVGTGNTAAGSRLGLTAAVTMTGYPGAVMDSGPAVVLGTPLIASGIYTGYSGGAGTLDARKSNVSDGTTAGPSSAAAAAAALHLGHNATTYWANATAELFIVNRVLTSTELADAQTYLATRWGIT